MSNLYFNHSYSLRNQTEILELRAEFGINGYGLYLMLLETIAESDTRSINKTLITGLAFNLGCEKTLLINLIKKCIDLKLFTVDGNFIASTHLKEHFEKREAIRKARVEAGSKGGKANAKQLLSKREAKGKQKVPKVNKNKDKVKIKESKDKTNKKEKEIKEVLDHFNRTHNKNLKSFHAWQDNFEFWLETYTLEEIKTAITRLNHPDWWAKDKPSLELLFRKANKNGKCDYIGQLLELEEESEAESESDIPPIIIRAKWYNELELQQAIEDAKKRNPLGKIKIKYD